jgi:hypothetical protein
VSLIDTNAIAAWSGLPSLIEQENNSEWGVSLPLSSLLETQSADQNVTCEGEHPLLPTRRCCVCGPSSRNTNLGSDNHTACVNLKHYGEDKYLTVYQWVGAISSLIVLGYELPYS